jgi:predicted porin
MQKKIIALAVATALTAPALALADGITVYGKADIGYGSFGNGTVSTQEMSSQVTKLGFKGNEDLGDGLNAIWQIEQQIDLNNAGGGNSTHNTFAGRNSFLGLKGESWGTFLMGRHDTPYKESTRHLDVFGDQMADNRHLMGGGVTASSGSYMDMRPGNELMYYSPDMSGFKFSASYVAGADTADKTGAATVKGSVWSLDGVYEAGPFYGAVAYQNVKFGTAGSGQIDLTNQKTAAGIAAGDSLKAWKAGVGYWVTDSLRLVGVYEKLTSSIAASPNANVLGRTDWNLGGIYKFGNDDVKLSYTKAGNSGGVANTGAKMIGVGYDHNMSKRTSLYAMYNKLTNDSAATFGFNGAATTAVVAGVANQSVTGFMVGMKHTF